MSFNEQRAARQIDPVAGAYFAGSESLSQTRIDFLLSHGVSARALIRDSDGGGYPIASAKIVVDGERVFDFAAEDEREPVVEALLVVARDRNGDPADLVCWAPRSQLVASYRGRVGLLGEQALHTHRFDGPPKIHRCFLDWLRGERDGVLIVNQMRAGRVLVDMPDRLIAEDAAHAAEIATLMSGCLDLQRIVIPVRKAA